MPRYDYRCNTCKDEFELVQTFAEAGKGNCPRCSGAGQRVYHSVPVIYKGSGFYTTDYGRPKPPAESKNGSSDSSSSSSSDSKPSADSKTDTAAKSTSDSAAKSSSESSSSSTPSPSLSPSSSD